MNHLTSQQQRELEETLRQELQITRERLRSGGDFGLDDSLRDQTGELSAYDNHPADLATESYERSKDLSLTEHAETYRAELEKALERMGGDRYGICRVCGEPIPYERLAAMPTAETCIQHVPDRQVSQRRPVEEEFLHPPFGRTGLDEQGDQTQFDGEDAWQIVESWGNSDSPAMAENPEIEDYNDMYLEAFENEGFVEAYESFVATDIHGRNTVVVRNKAYRDYMAGGEGEPLLEPDRAES